VTIPIAVMMTAPTTTRLIKRFCCDLEIEDKVSVGGASLAGAGSGAVTTGAFGQG